MGDRLKGKNAVVTGSGRGIGRAHALALAAEGARVVVNDLGVERDGTGKSGSPADEVVAEIKKLGSDAVANYDSVSDLEGAKRIIQTCVDKFGKIDILVNNAGFGRDRFIHNMSDEEWDSVIKVHLYGTFYTCRAAAQQMRNQGWGRIVNTSSQAGAWGRPGQANYAAAKEGIVGLTRVLARELGPKGVTVNAIRPRAGTRMVLNPDTQAAWEKEGRLDFIAQSKMLKPEHVAAFVTYLCTDEAKNINGCVFVAGTDGIGLYREPEPPYKVIYSADLTWDVDGLVERLPMSLTEGLVNPAPPKKKE